MKRRFSKTLCASCAAVIAVSAASAVSVSAWAQYRGDETNNGVTSAKTPASAEDAVLYWATRIGTDMWGADGPSPLTLNGDTLYFSAADKIYKMDKNTGETVASGDMVGSPAWGITPPLYADDMVFVGLNNGTVQAFDADTLESLWVYKNDKGGQTNAAITYNDGRIYTGFWNSETTDADFVCIDVTDEDASTGLEEKTAEWSYTSKGGFYWAGAYINDSFAVVGTEDGENGSDSETAKVVTFDKQTGEQLDVLEGIKGDIRTCIVYFADTDRYYFATKGGLFCSVKIDENGRFSDLQTVDVGAAVTSTPVLANGRAYVGTAGVGWSKYNGAAIAVIDLDSNSLAYKAETAASPQTSGLLSVGDDGYNYVYFVENTSPSKIRYVKDKQGVTEVLEPSEEEGHICAPVLFTPAGAQDNYGMYNPICDEDGTIYFKNDSSYIMAVGSAVRSLSVSGGTVFREGSAPAFTVTAEFANGVEKDISHNVTYSVDELTTEDSIVTVTYDYALYKDGEDGAGTAVKPFTLDVDVIVLSAEDYDAVENVTALIDGLGEITLDSGEAIAEAEQAYDSLGELGVYVANYDVLTAARSAYEELLSESSSSESAGGSGENSSDESGSDSGSESSSDDTSSEGSSEVSSSGSSSASEASSSSKAAAGTSDANPSTGAVQGGLAFAAAALLGCAVVKRRKQ